MSNWISVESTIIKEICYDITKHTLYLNFYKTGVYKYFPVPESVYEKLIESESIGIFYHAKIKDKYNCLKYDES